MLSIPCKTAVATGLHSDVNCLKKLYFIPITVTGYMQYQRHINLFIDSNRPLWNAEHFICLSGFAY